MTGVEKRAVEEASPLGPAPARPTLIEEPMAAAMGPGPSHLGADRQHGGRYRRWHNRGCGDLARRYVVSPVDPGRKATRWTRRSTNSSTQGWKLLIGQQTAEEVELEIGSAWPLPENEIQAEVRGRDMLAGLPKTVVIGSEDVAVRWTEPVDQILDAIRGTLDKTPPELAADIMDRGIVLAGGGALLSGLDRKLGRTRTCPCTSRNHR